MVIVVPDEFVHVNEDGGREADPGVWFCHIGGVKYHSTISRDAVEASPAWKPSQPLPLSLDRAVQAAQTLLRRLVRSDSQWALTDISLQRLRDVRPERWFFVVGFQRETGKRSLQGIVQICVDFRGQPGTITLARTT